MTMLPSVMRVLEVSALAPDLAGVGLAERPVPQPGAGQALVRIEAASLGFPDLLMTEGLYQAKPALPFVPGMEAAGEVVAVGEGSRWAVGDKVIVATLTGAVVQYGVFADAALLPLPAGLSYAEGASLRAAYITAYTAIARIGQAQPGEALVVHGAAGGVGLAAVDLGKALGLTVIAVASSAEKREAIQRLYTPDHVLAGPTGLREQILELTGGRGADLVYDPVGGDVFDEACRYTAFGGRLLVVGFAGGRIAEVRTNIPLIKGFSVVGVRAGEYGRRFPSRGAEDMAAILGLAGEGRIRPHVHSAVPLADWREAYLAMRERRVIGRTVILPNA
ncbi:NADPH:quinone oxidoreductase family protein [Novosphingobium sp.]|uniref:NADPH:quinone oxidoreductase family protein n=1 Tax=Novosphingobium sp. TaxID=1874826 RepID=UPI0034535D97